MSGAVVLGSVFVVHVLAILSPGPNVLVVSQTAASASRRAGVFAALGIATGAALWSGAALLGLAVLFERVAWLYGAIAALGGLYLLYLAARLWRGAARPLAQHAQHAQARDGVRSDLHAYRLGLLTNLTNPKALLFYGGIFAALVPPTLPAATRVAAFGVIVVNSALWHAAFAWLFSAERSRRRYAQAKRWIDRVAAAALALLALRLMLPPAWRALAG